MCFFATYTHTHTHIHTKRQTHGHRSNACIFLRPLYLWCSHAPIMMTVALIYTIVRSIFSRRVCISFGRLRPVVRSIVNYCIADATMLFADGLSCACVHCSEGTLYVQDVFRRSYDEDGQRPIGAKQ